MDFNNYKEVSYKELQKTVWQAWTGYKDNGGDEVKLATSLKLKTTHSARNAFNDKKQKVSDELLSGVIDCLGMDALIVYHKRKRLYYIKK